MQCLYETYRSWCPGMDDGQLKGARVDQERTHTYEEVMKRHGNIAKWHGQSTYNMAVRQELRKRGLL